MALTESQSKWMYKKLDDIYKKYYPRLPFSQETWDEFMKDIKALDSTKTADGESMGSKYKDSREMIFALAEYLDKLNAKGYKGDCK